MRVHEQLGVAISYFCVILEHFYAENDFNRKLLNIECVNIPARSSQTHSANIYLFKVNS